MPINLACTGAAIRTLAPNTAAKSLSSYCVGPHKIFSNDAPFPLGECGAKRSAYLLIHAGH